MSGKGKGQGRGRGRPPINPGRTLTAAERKQRSRAGVVRLSQAELKFIADLEEQKTKETDNFYKYADRIATLVATTLQDQFKENLSLHKSNIQRKDDLIQTVIGSGGVTGEDEEY